MGKKHYKKEIIGILLITISVFTTLSFLTYDPYETPMGLSPEVARSNIMGNFGIYVSYYLMKFTFGLGAFFIPLIIFIYGYCLFSHKKINNYFKTTSYIFYLGVWISVVTGLIGKLLGAWWKVEYSGSVGMGPSLFGSKLVLSFDACTGTGVTTGTGVSNVADGRGSVPAGGPSAPSFSGVFFLLLL